MFLQVLKLSYLNNTKTVLLFSLTKFNNSNSFKIEINEKISYIKAVYKNGHIYNLLLRKQ